MRLATVAVVLLTITGGLLAGMGSLAVGMLLYFRYLHWL